jgi:hypothetical protein
MIRLLIGLCILRGPRGTSRMRTSPGSIKRRALLGICCVVIASSATHSSTGHVASGSPFVLSRPNMARNVPDAHPVRHRGRDSPRAEPPDLKKRRH